MNFNHWKRQLKADVDILNFMVIPMLILDVVGLIGLGFAGSGIEALGVLGAGLFFAALLQMVVGFTQVIMTIVWTTRGSNAHIIYLVAAILCVLGMYVLSDFGFILFFIAKFMGYGYWIWTKTLYNNARINDGQNISGREDLLDDLYFEG